MRRAQHGTGREGRTMDVHPVHRLESTSSRMGRPSVRRSTRLLLAVLATVGLLLATAGTASARPGHHPHQPGTLEPRVDGLAGPLSISVDQRGGVLVDQGFAGVMSRIDLDAQVHDLTAEEGLSAVAAGPFGTQVFSVRTDAGTSLLKLRLHDGKVIQLADIGAYEAANNPDAGTSYGAQGISPSCAAQWPVDDLGPATYPGQIDSNPYQLAVVPGGVYIADAGANAIFFSDWAGHLKTVAVLPPQPMTIPADPTSLGIPTCAAGLTYNFEPVPTDIEISWTGAYVSLLPGGPEDASLGPRGSVVKLDLLSGQTRTIATGLLGATNLAVTTWGDVYVTELFAGKVDRITRSGPQTVIELPDAAAVEWSRGRLYIAYDVFGSGKVATLPV